jgi:hypothetical protein
MEMATLSVSVAFLSLLSVLFIYLAPSLGDRDKALVH